jgi:hypothetical protein
VKKIESKTDGKLAAIFRDTMVMWDQLKANGASLDERVRGLENVLRGAWPFTREWKYVCDHCNDTGLMMAECPGDRTCGRPRPHGAHEFGRSCWCELGKKFRDKPKPAPEDFAAAGKTRKPTLVGR